MDLTAMAKMLMTLPPTERARQMNNMLVGLDAHMGIQFVSVDVDRVEAKLPTTAQHTQPYGLIHGGVYATLGESICSVGAAIGAMLEGKNAVGAENTTRFHRASRPPTTLHITATPDDAEQTGALRHWTAEIHDDEGNHCATSRVVVAILNPRRDVAGAPVQLVNAPGTNGDD